jgi:hypothetical protein
MTGPSAFRAVYSDFKLVRTRSVIQVILEVPIEDSDAAYEVLGGMPQPSKERWFAIAALKDQKDSTPSVPQPQPVPDKPQAGAKRSWKDLAPSQQAGIRCDEPSFQEFLKAEYALIDVRNAASCVRAICGIASRAELNTNQKARVIWHQLNDQYQAWMRVGA